MEMQEHVAKICKDMEPLNQVEMTGVENEGVRTTALASIAISLKRIADHLDGGPEKFGLVDGIMNAIEQGAIAARNG